MISIVCASASAQTLKWTYTVTQGSQWILSTPNFMPGENTQTSINDESSSLFAFAPDGRGGGAFVFPEYTGSYWSASRVIWLNRLGKLVYDSDTDNSFSPIPLADTPRFTDNAGVVRVTSTELMVFSQFIEYPSVIQSVVDFTVSGGKIKNLHIPMSSTAALGVHPPMSDPTGFFMFDQNGNNFTISRYSYATP